MREGNRETPCSWTRSVFIIAKILSTHTNSMHHNFIWYKSCKLLGSIVSSRHFKCHTMWWTITPFELTFCYFYIIHLIKSIFLVQAKPGKKCKNPKHIIIRFWHYFNIESLFQKWVLSFFILWRFQRKKD